MKRWFYILLGAVGIMLAIWSAFMFFDPPWVPPAYERWLVVAEIVLGILGVILGWVGFLNGRKAGEFDIGQYVRSSRKRDHHVAGMEIEFSCPACHKIYRASPLLAGKPFSCRECGGTFVVNSNAPALPGPTQTSTG
jgi:predicted RNA-binding Zn-ribbon protein involved in translation (DUF1610 family)